MASQEVLIALETLHREIEKLEPAIKHVETAQEVTQMVKGIPQMHIDLIEEVLKTDSQFKIGLQKICEKEMLDITTEQKSLQKVTTEIHHQVKREQTALAKLKDIVEDFHNRVEKINFPERLDKLDANVAGIMAAIQSIQSRLDGLERNIADRLRDIQDYQKESRANIQNGLDQTKSLLQTTANTTAKKQQMLAFITWFLIALCSIILFLRS